MSVSARTFQLLYIIRQRALDDQPTKLGDFSDFIAARRKDAPDIYYRAYIAPSALVPLLQRMTTEERVLTLDLSTREYEFTPMGSQMADLLVNLDACSSHFIDNYKEEICLAVLQQRQRLGQGAVSPREVSSISNISLDSARRGLEALAAEGKIVEDRSSRTPVYSLPAPPVVEVEDDVEPEELPVAKPPVSEEEIEKAARKGLDIAAALAEIDEDDPTWACGVGPTPKVEDDEDILPLPLGKILQDDGPDVEENSPHFTQDPFKFTPPPPPTAEELEEDDDMDPQWEAEENPYNWNSVPAETREGLILRAKSAGVSLTDFFDILNALHEEKVRAALFEGMADLL